MLGTIVDIHGDEEQGDVGHHKGRHQPREPPLEQPEVTVTVAARGGGCWIRRRQRRGTPVRRQRRGPPVRRRRSGPPPPPRIDGGVFTARMNLDLNSAGRWVPPHDEI